MIVVKNYRTVSRGRQSPQHVGLLLWSPWQLRLSPRFSRLKPSHIQFQLPCKLQRCADIYTEMFTCISVFCNLIWYQAISWVCLQYSKLFVITVVIRVRSALTRLFLSSPDVSDRQVFSASLSTDDVIGLSQSQHSLSRSSTLPYDHLPQRAQPQHSLKTKARPRSSGSEMVTLEEFLQETNLQSPLMVKYTHRTSVKHARTRSHSELSVWLSPEEYWMIWESLRKSEMVLVDVTYQEIDYEMD